MNGMAEEGQEGAADPMAGSNRASPIKHINCLLIIAIGYFQVDLSTEDPGRSLAGSIGDIRDIVTTRPAFRQLFGHSRIFFNEGAQFSRHRLG